MDVVGFLIETEKIEDRVNFFQLSVFREFENLKFSNQYLETLEFACGWFLVCVDVNLIKESHRMWS